MKFTLSWLKEYLDTDASLEEICSTLTAIGLELEGLDDPSATFAPFTVAEVTKAEQHPDADKLKVLNVKTATAENLQVVCGAPNARAGMKGVFAPEGSYIPGLDVTLKKSKIRGVESNGMMVSEREMCLSDEHEGIIEVDSALEIGTPMADVFGLNDPIIEINLTPNRPDCAGIYGIARDLAAAGLGRFKPIKIDTVKSSFKSDIDVVIKDTDGCPHFLGREIRGLKNAASPDWLQQKLKAIGLRPISALVDITNFFTIGFARPLHVYDAALLKSPIEVRTATGKEEFEALNDKTYQVNEGAIGIYDQSGILGLGGIVGGTSTGVSETTTSIYLEAAYFDPARIARTGRDLSVISDARYRFERGVDPEFTAQAIELATAMILEICGDETSEVSDVVTAGAAPEWKRSISYSPSMMTTLIGVDLEADQQVSLLQSLGFDVGNATSKEGPYDVTPPSWRPDVFGAADLTEEIIRLHGFDKIPSVSVKAESSAPASAETPNLTRSRQARAALAARGLHECVTWSFMNKEAAIAFGLNDNDKRESLTVVNAISSEIDVMRPSILPNLIQAAGRNAAQGYADTQLFEVGPVFEGVKPDDQKHIAAGIRYGLLSGRHWSSSDAQRAVDAYDAKADSLAALAAIGAPAANAQITTDAPDYFHPGRSGAVRLGKNVLAYFGELHPAMLEALDVKGPVVGFEVMLDNVPAARKKGTEKPYLKLNPLQPVHKDFAYLLDDAVSAAEIKRAVFGADKKLITDVSIFDIYKGQGVEPGKKSVALSVTLQPQDETFSDKDIEAVMQAITQSVEKQCGGVLRG